MLCFVFGGFRLTVNYSGGFVVIMLMQFGSLAFGLEVETVWRSPSLHQLDRVT